MNIIFDLRPCITKYNTGIPQYINYLLKNLLKIDKKNKYFLFWTGVKKPIIDKEILNSPKTKILTLKIPNRFLNLSLFLFNFPKLNNFFKFKTEDTLWFSPHFVNLPLSKGFKKITVVHDLSFFYFPEFLTFKDKIFHHIQKIKKNLKESEKIITISNSTKNDIIKFFGIKKEKIKTIYHGIDKNKFKKIKNKKELEKFRKKYNLEKKFDYLLYLGPIEPRKNIESIIYGFSELSEDLKRKTKLIIAGYTLRNIYSKNRNIIFIKNVKEKDKVYLYNISKIFLYPSYFEGFGLPILEAMACQKPVITSFTSSIYEIFSKYALIVNPYNVTEVKNALELLLKSKALYNYYKSKSKDAVKNFSWKKTARETLKIINNLNK